MTSSRPSEQETPTPSRMWPVDYILQSAYSPLHLERQLPKRQWRDAFEDLLALESNGEMISLESRKRETEMGVKILYAKLSDMIYTTNRRLRDLAPAHKRALETREKAMLEGDMRKVLRIDENLSRGRLLLDKVMEIHKTMARDVEVMKNFPASRLKNRGSWIASLISSGVLPDWSSRLEAGARDGESLTSMIKSTDPPVKFDEEDCIIFTENELRRRFGGAESSRRKMPSGGVGSRAAGLRSDEVTINEDHGRGKSTSGANPSWQYPTAQTTTSERVLLPDGSIVNKVVLTNHFCNGKEERIEIIQDAAKVLEEVEKARMLMHGVRIDW